MSNKHVKITMQGVGDENFANAAGDMSLAQMRQSIQTPDPTTNLQFGAGLGDMSVNCVCCSGASCILDNGLVTWDKLKLSVNTMLSNDTSFGSGSGSGTVLAPNGTPAKQTVAKATGQGGQAKKNNTTLFVGIGVVVVGLGIIIALAVRKKVK